VPALRVRFDTSTRLRLAQCTARLRLAQRPEADPVPERAQRVEGQPMRGCYRRHPV